MKKFKLTRLIIFTVGAFFMMDENVLAQKITSARTIQNIYPIDTKVELTVDFIDYVQNSSCGVTIDWGNGDKEDVRIGDEGKRTSPFSVSHIYKSAGEYVVRLEGKFQLRGLASVLPCSGRTETTTISLIDPRIELLLKQKQEADNETKKINDALNEKLRILAQKEIELKQRELEIKEAQLKQQELEIMQLKSNSNSSNQNVINSRNTEKNQTKPSNLELNKANDLLKCKRLGLKEDSDDFKICLNLK